MTRISGNRWARDMAEAYAHGWREHVRRQAQLGYYVGDAPIPDPLVWYEAQGRHGALDASQPGHNRQTVRLSRSLAAQLAADEKARESAEWARRLARAEAKAKKLRRHIATLRRIVKGNRGRCP